MHQPTAEETAAPSHESKRRHVLVVYNPTAGQRMRKRYTTVMTALEKLGVTVTERQTSKRGDALKFIEDVPASAYDALVIAGGDGTVNEAINGLRSDSPPLAIVPLGTANVLAAEIKLDPDPSHVAHTIARAPASTIHLGVVNDHRFVMMASVGIDAHVVKNVCPKLKRITGKGAYVWQTLVELGRFRSPVYTVTVNGVSRNVGSAIFANGHYYGGQFTSVPEAKLDDGRLHACLLEGRGRLNIVRYGMALTQNRLSRLKDVSTFGFVEAYVDGPEGDPIQADGDIVGTLPAVVRSDPTPLPIICPAQGPRD